MQAIYFQQTGTYISRQDDLSEVVSSDEKVIMDTFINLKNGDTVDFDKMSETLFAWVKKRVERTE